MSDNRLELPPNTLHRCRACKCLWRRWVSDGTWSLADAEQRACGRCDNSPEFISLLDPPPEIDLRRQLTQAQHDIATYNRVLAALGMQDTDDDPAEEVQRLYKQLAEAQAQAAALREAAREFEADLSPDCDGPKRDALRQALAALEEKPNAEAI